MDFDAIVIGSGFGGAVCACRLAEAGYSVLVLERGRRWDASNYPRNATDPWWWSNDEPEKRNGWLDLRVFRHMAVAQGAAVGGGSLIYANVSAVPDRAIFDSGWPEQITWDLLAPYYATVGGVMNVQKVPNSQWPERTRLMREAAAAIGAEDRFQILDLAISFDPEWHYDLPDRFNKKHSRRFINDHGVEQGTCLHLANCDVGCDVDAKNTLDRNYLALAERHRADVRALHLVTNLEPCEGGYLVHYDRIERGRRIPGSATARLVVLAAGSLGSTEMLLRCRDVTRTLPSVSARLGFNWSGNGDFLTPAIYSDRTVCPSHGPTITSSINFLDRSEANQSFWVQDGGFPNIAANWLAGEDPSNAQAQAFVQFINEALRRHGPLENLMPWFAQGIDAGNGRLRLGRRWWLARRTSLVLDWSIDQSRAAIEAIVAMHTRLANATGGHALVPPYWKLDSYLITPHPLGGCCMASNVANGVVDHMGEVFGYRNLYVIDGAMIPRAIGVNPSRSIAALAEYAVGTIISEGR